MPAPPAVAVAIDPRVVLLMLGVVSAILGAWSWALIKLAQGDPLLPRERRRIVPWGSASVLAVVMLHVALQFGAGFGYLLVRWISGEATGGMKAELTLRDNLMLMGLVSVLIVDLAPAFLRLTTGADLADLGLTARDLGRNLARGAVACALLLPIIYGVMALAVHVWPAQSHPVEQAIRNDPRATTALLAVFAAVVAAPLAEELLFRGVLLGWLWKVGIRRPGSPDGEVRYEERDLDPFVAAIVAHPDLPSASPPIDPFAGRAGRDWLANITASVIFAGLHFGQWPAPVPLFLLSLGLGELYRRTGSLVAPIALHAAFNGLSMAVLLLGKAAGMGPN